MKDKIHKKTINLLLIINSISIDLDECTKTVYLCMFNAVYKESVVSCLKFTTLYIIEQTVKYIYTKL